MQFSAECIFLALPFKCNVQITWQKITSWEKWISGGETPLTPIHSALDRERPRMDRDVLLQPVQKPEVTSQCQFSSIRHSLVKLMWNFLIIKVEINFYN